MGVPVNPSMVNSEIRSQDAAGRAEPAPHITMTRDHFGFVLFLLLLLIAPRLPLAIPGLPPSTTLPLGIVGLLAWAAVSPHHLDRMRRPIMLPIPLMLVALSIYALFSSFLSGSLVSAGYSLQYFAYLFLGYFMLTGYVRRTVTLGETRVMFNILGFVFFIYTAGLLVSIWTGPIYAHQVSGFQLATGISEVTFRATGFANGVNTAAATIMAFLCFVGFSSGRWRNIGFLLVILGLLLTLSRSGLFAVVIAGILVLILRTVGTARTRFVTTRWFILPWVLIMSGLLYVMVFTPTFDVSGGDGVVSTVLSRFSSSGDYGVTAAYEGRLRSWERGFNVWADGNLIEMVFGHGFRGTQQVAVASSAWATPHNSYIALLGDLGVIGLALLILPLWMTISMLAIRMMKKRDPTSESFAFAGMVALSVHSMTGLFLYSPILITQILIITIVVSELSFGARPMNQRPAFKYRRGVGAGITKPQTRL
jgi:hypothetical protein